MSMEANPTPNNVIDAGSGTATGSAKAGKDSMDNKKTEYVRRMDFS
jgi:hypothetical protein